MQGSNEIFVPSYPSLTTVQELWKPRAMLLRSLAPKLETLQPPQERGNKIFEVYHVYLKQSKTFDVESYSKSTILTYKLGIIYRQVTRKEASFLEIRKRVRHV